VLYGALQRGRSGSNKREHFSSSEISRTRHWVAHHAVRQRVGVVAGDADCAAPIALSAELPAAALRTAAKTVKAYGAKTLDVPPSCALSLCEYLMANKCGATGPARSVRLVPLEPTFAPFARMARLVSACSAPTAQLVDISLTMV